MVSDAILDAAASMAAERGVLAVSMSQIAEAAGIGRATLYKYFPSVEAILLAWHEREISAHLGELAQLAHSEAEPVDRMRAVAQRYALIRYEHRDHNLAPLVHQGSHIARAQHHLVDLFASLISQAASAGQVRDDVPAHELAAFCVYALDGAADARSRAAVQRLTGLTLSALMPGALGV